MKLRKALPEEADVLNQFIRASKAVWGYSEDFLDEYIKNWGITKESIEKSSIKVLEHDGEIHGVFRLAKNKKKNAELDLFFVNPKFIKTGIGRKMWGIIDESARAKKWKGFELVVDPNAEKFFHRMGAKTVRVAESFVVMKYELLPTARHDAI
ncbi:MAG TPA: GNAT family N-acetyltransferase [Gammaproteobacteria bacterium]|nr:GNAT family N-acetyltransferase [Gammaproteobacteria bacterium]